jgi:hypothetical protein
MKQRKSLAPLALVLAILACNLPWLASNGPPTSGPSLGARTQPAVTATPSQTPLPSETPSPTPTSTPTIPIAWPVDKGVNCRFGPGKEWMITGALLPGQTATVKGRFGDFSWLYVVTPNDPDSPCWVAASVINTAGNLSALQVLEEPQAYVIDMKLRLDPETINLPACTDPVQPITIRGTIQTNGPAVVKWHFETQAGGALADQQTRFSSADSKGVEGTYSPAPGAGTFWVRLVVASPNQKAAEAKYQITCP